MQMGACRASSRLVRAPSPSAAAGSSSSSSWLSSLKNLLHRASSRHSSGLVTVRFALLVLCIIASSSSSCFGAPPDVQAGILLKFKASLSNVEPLKSWDPSANPCRGNNTNWVGVICYKGKVWGLQLENMGLKGKVDIEALVSLPLLRTLSFMNNTLAGSIPNFTLLSKLKAVYLSYNQFSGVIPDEAFVGMKSLKKLYLGNNQFTGKIPATLVTLPRLLVLRLEYNKFEGRVPEFKQQGLTLNVAHNLLSGPLPSTFSDMEPVNFAGNLDLCGGPLDSCATPRLIRQTPPAVKMLLVVLIVALIVAIIAIACISCLHSRRSKRQSSSGRVVTKAGGNHYQNTWSYNVGSSAYSAAVDRNKVYENNATRCITGGRCKKAAVDPGKLTFIREERDKFDLQDLLRASAEILGSNNFGSSYKAIVLDGQAIVVKRFTKMNNFGRDEFQEHMRRIGSLRHPNVLPLVAYYYRREEKLLLTDFVDNGSLAVHLHGNHNADQPCLDWPTRLKIIKGVAKGLAYLNSALPSLVAPHGHLKSSNVLLDESFEPLLTDYALVPVTNAEHAHPLMTVFKSPEFAQNGYITQKSDVWNLGVLILEILTGKFPENYLTEKHNSEADIASWVNSMVADKRTGDVFDAEMGGVRNNKSEMIKLLKIGLSCCEVEMSTRLDLHAAHQQIDDLNEGDDEEGEHSSAHLLNKGDPHVSNLG